MSVDDVRAYQDWCSLVVASLGALMAQTARFGSEESAPQHGETTAAYLRRIAGDEPLETYEEGLRRPIPLREPRTYAQYLIDRGILEGWIVEHRAPRA